MQNVVFVHGWGYNPNVWRAVTAQMHDIKPLYIDLGFITGSRGAIIETVPEDSIVVGHSLGVMWLLKQKKKYKGFVSIGGFDCFHAHVPQQDIMAMQKHLERNPYAQLHGFWEACGARSFCPPSEVNVDKLKEGLEWLATWDARKELAALKCPLMALATEDDPIIRRDISAKIWKKKDLRVLETGSHAMPLTVPAWCARQIEDFAKSL